MTVRLLGKRYFGRRKSSSPDRYDNHVSEAEMQRGVTAQGLKLQHKLNGHEVEDPRCTRTSPVVQHVAQHAAVELGQGAPLDGAHE
jgi:hypothetical protein